MPSPLTPGEESFESGIRELAGMLLSGETSRSVLASVTTLAGRVLPNCDAASITLIRNGRPSTPVCSAELAQQLDQSQYDSGEGPCLEAIRTAAVVRVHSMAESGRWSAFSADAVRQGVASSLSLPLTVRDEVIGALNLYSTTVGGFDAGGAEQAAALFAGQAAAVLANAVAVERAEELARQLLLALEHRDVIGQAKGILMATEGIGPDDAFDLLRRASQRANRKLYDMAVEMVQRRGSRRGEG